MHIIKELELEVSERAYRSLLAVVNNQNEAVYVRVGNPGKGCVQGKFSIALDSEKTPSDKTYSCDELTFLIHPSDHMFLAGRSIDFKKDISGKSGYILS